MRRITQSVAWWLLTAAVTPLMAQCPINTDNTQLLINVDPNSTVRFFYLRLAFNQVITHVPAKGDVKVELRPSGQMLSIDSVTWPSGRPNELDIRFKSDVLPPADTTAFRVDVSNIAFTTSTDHACTSDSMNYYNQGSLKKLLDLRQQQFQDAIASAKTSDERNIFAALSGAAVPGKSGGAAGDAQVNLNYWILPGLNGTLIINKNSQTQADPKQFQFGFTVRRAVTLFLEKGSHEGSCDEGPSLTRSQILQGGDACAAANRKIVNLIIDGAGRFEGDATHFGVSNGVFDLPIQLGSRTMKFGAESDKSYWRFRLLPAGAEFGRNLGSTNPNLQNYTILRYKTGGELGFVFAPSSENTFPRSAELDVQSAVRYLEHGESAWDMSKNDAISVARGWHPWTQADARVYLFEGDYGRIGFRVSFIRGGLPPVFNDTHAFRFGLLFETKDDKTSQGRPL